MDEKSFLQDESNLPSRQENSSPIEGQIDIADLIWQKKQMEDDKHPQTDFGVADGQISFDTIINNEENMRKKDDNKKELLNKLDKEKTFERTNKELDLLKKVSKGSSAIKSTTKNDKGESLPQTKVVKGKAIKKSVSTAKTEDKKQVDQVKKVERTRKTKIESKDEVFDADMFFNDEIAIKTRSEIDDLNRGYQDVDRVVGSDVFGKVKEVKKNDVEKVYTETAPEEIVDGILYKNLDAVLHESMIPYSEHVILDRALPRVEDGLKPVQRRILYAMNELGITPDKPFKKSARIVGDCLGKYHPHGDTSVYDALVRMAQPFNSNQILIEGHGNFGSIDGDGAAAMRYTEARLSPLSMELLRDLDKNTVKWGLNFDDSLKEPEMLPGRFPNLLVNGATGIAVGLATNIPPHNLAECIDGVVEYINNPKITLKQMLKIIKGPDFPTGGDILSNSELYTAYETGRGKIYVRAKMHVEGDGDKKSIVITELPYQVNKANLLQKIVMLKEDEKYDLSGIAEVRDESDRDGMRAVIRLKKDANVNKI